MKKFEETLEGIIKKTFGEEIAFNRVKKGKSAILFQFE